MTDRGSCAVASAGEAGPLDRIGDGAERRNRTPESPLELRLADLWREVLGRAEVSLDDDFFESGGHSLHALQLLLRVRERLGREVPPRLLFEHPTLGAMARALEEPGERGVGPAAANDRERDRIEGPLGTPPGPVRLPRGEPLPASLAQRQLWYLDRLRAAAEGGDAGDASYNLLVVVRLREHSPDVAALRRALDALGERHEVLRTRFEAIDGEPHQIVDPALRPPFATIDGSALDPRRFAGMEHTLTEELLRRPFDLARDAMLRGGLLLGAAGHRFVLTMHHIASDGWSIGVMLRELATLYRAFRHNASAAPPPFLPLELQYADVAAHQDAAIEGERGRELLSFWERQLRDAPQHLEGIADRAAVAGRGGRNPGASRSFFLASDRLAGLAELARGHGATLFMTLLAAWGALLYRRSWQRDQLHSVPFAGRLHPASEGLVGFFTNMLVLRLDVNESSAEPACGGGAENATGVRSFASLLAATREFCLDAFAHQDLPFVRLVEALRPERESGRMPFVQLGFALQNAFRSDRFDSVFEIVPTEAHSGTSRFELSLSMTEEIDGLSGTFEYRTDLYEAATVARLAEGLAALVAAVAAHPTTPLDRLDLLSPGERHQLLVELAGDDLQFDLSRTLPSRVEDQVALRPDAECARFRGATLTYGELGRLSSRLARRMRASGLRLGSPVGIYLERSLDLPVAFLAVLRAGGVAVPLDPDHPADRLRFLLDDTRAEIAIADPRLSARLPSTWRGTVVDPAAARAAEPEEPDSKDEPAGEPAPTPDDLAYVVYTSGSTGQPKGVLMHHRGLANRLLWQQAAYPLRPDDRVLQNLSIGFDASTWQIFAPLIVGASIVLPPPGEHIDVARLGRSIVEEQVTAADFVPSVLAALLDAAVPGEGAWAPALRQVVSGGEALDRALARRVFSALPNARLVNVYGPTETSLTISAATADRRGRSPSVPIGRPIANTRAYLLDASGQPVPFGVAGEVFASGVGLTFGYQNRADLSAERFVPNPFSALGGERLYRTGDFARRLADGTLEFLGRVDRQVKIRGVRVELQEIEAHLREQPGVLDAAVLARTDVPGAAPGEKRLVAYVVPDRPGDGSASGSGSSGLTPASLRAGLAEHVPAPLVPGAYVFLAAMPVTVNGKVDRAALPAPDGGERAVVPPRDRFEAELVAIWRRALGLDEVSVTDHFFDLGGHSLLAVKLMSEIQRRMDVALGLADLYSAGTVEEMARRIRERTRRPSGAPILLSASRSADRSLETALFCVHAIDGAVHGYAQLAWRLGERVAVFGLEAPGVEASACDGGATWPVAPPAPLDDFEALAAHHVRALIEHRPEGPFALCGWSTGGLLASAMAARLEDLGRPAERLILLDTHRPRSIGDGGGAAFSPRAHRTPVLLIQGVTSPAHLSAQVVEELRALQIADCRALTLGSFEIEPLAADHHGLLSPPAVADVAERIEKELRRGAQ